MLGAGHRLGGQNQDLLDELARALTQQVIDGELGLTDHGQQRQGRLRVGGQQRLFAQLIDIAQPIDIEFAGDAGFGFRLFCGGRAFLALRLLMSEPTFCRP